METKNPANKKTSRQDIPKRSEEDRRAQQASRLAKVMKIQECLLSREKWNVTSLADELECSQKTIHRYLYNLR